MVLCCVFWCQSFVNVSPNVCLFYFGSVSIAEWPPFGKKAAHSVEYICILTILI